MITPRYCCNLILLSSVSFGSHFSISSLSMYGVFLIEAKVVSPLGMGFLFAANYISSLFLPLLVGYLIDSTSKVQLIAVTLLLVTTLGQMLLVFALCKNLFILALFAQALFGSGASSVSAIQRISIVYYLKGNEALTTSVYVSFGSIAKLLGKTIVGPVALNLGSYQKALLLPALLCTFSLCCYVAFILSNPTLTKDDDQTLPHNESAILEQNLPFSLEMTDTTSAPVPPFRRHQQQQRSYSDYQQLSADEHIYECTEREQMAACDPRAAMCTDEQHALDEEANTSSLQRMRRNGEMEEKECTRDTDQRVVSPSILELIHRLPLRFYLFAVVHTVYIMVFHILWNFIPHYVTVRYGIDIVDTGLIAGFPAMLTIILAPLIGLLVNRFGHSVFIGCVAASLAGVAYLLLLFADVSPVIPIAMLSLAQATMPTVLLANISLCLTGGCTGIAFGIVEVLDSVANLLGNSLFGYLYEATGGYSAGLSVLCAFSILGLTMLVYILLWDLRCAADESGGEGGGDLKDIVEQQQLSESEQDLEVSSLLVSHGSHKSYHTM